MLSQDHSGVCVGPVSVWSEQVTQVVPLQLAAGDVVCDTELQMYDHVHLCRVKVIWTIFTFLPIGTSVHM